MTDAAATDMTAPDRSSKERSMPAFRARPRTSRSVVEVIASMFKKQLLRASLAFPLVLRMFSSASAAGGVEKAAGPLDACVDLKRFSPRQLDSKLRARWSPGGGPIGLYVGELTFRTNAELAMQAFRAARALIPGARLVVVGDGPARRMLQGKFPEVVFAGELAGEELAVHVASADVFLCPDADPDRGMILEALASAVPVVAFDGAKGSEHVGHRLNGLLLPEGDVRGFVSGACLLASLHTESLPMRRNARDAAIAAVLMKHVCARSDAVVAAGADKVLNSVLATAQRAIADAARHPAAPDVSHQRPS